MHHHWGGSPRRRDDREDEGREGETERVRGGRERGSEGGRERNLDRWRHVKRSWNNSNERYLKGENGFPEVILRLTERREEGEREDITGRAEKETDEGQKQMFLYICLFDDKK